MLSNGLEQLKAFLDMPDVVGWKVLAQVVVFKPLQVLASQRRVVLTNLRAALQTWRVGNALPALSHAADGDWVYNR